MRTAFLPPLVAAGEGAGRRIFLGLAPGDLRRAVVRVETVVPGGKPIYPAAI